VQGTVQGAGGQRASSRHSVPKVLWLPGYLSLVPSLRAGPAKASVTTAYLALSLPVLLNGDFLL
jgi:hypothetical protein